jgi:hypothetical protein
MVVNNNHFMDFKLENFETGNGKVGELLLNFV